MRRIMLIVVIALLAACGSPIEETAIPSITPLPSRTPQPTLTPVNFNQQSFPTAFIPPTSALPPISTIAPSPVPLNYTPQPSLLNGGRGLTNGAIQNNGEFQVEGFCTQRNPNWGVTEDGTRWYCTENGNRVFALGIAEFDSICIQTYSNPAAFAQQIVSSQPEAYRWRCFGLQ